MLKIYGVGRGRGAAAASASSNSANTNNKGETKSQHRTPGEIRMQKELDDLDLPPGMTISFPDKKDLMKFELLVAPSSGYWHKGKFRFVMTIPDGYPHDPPKVKCNTKIFHPNIDTDGNVCLNILREDWKPVLSIGTILYGMLHLFLEPNPIEPLNQEAADMLANKKSEFQKEVKQWMYRHGALD